MLHNDSFALAITIIPNQSRGTAHLVRPVVHQAHSWAGRKRLQWGTKQNSLREQRPLPFVTLALLLTRGPFGRPASAPFFTHLCPFTSPWRDRLQEWVMATGTWTPGPISLRGINCCFAVIEPSFAVVWSALVRTDTKWAALFVVSLSLDSEASSWTRCSWLSDLLLHSLLLSPHSSLVSGRILAVSCDYRSAELLLTLGWTRDFEAFLFCPREGAKLMDVQGTEEVIVLTHSQESSIYMRYTWANQV